MTDGVALWATHKTGCEAAQGMGGPKGILS